ncbi:hypothetical protein FB561_3628 [Kribbella amoyensis]|uniref:Uncharacterized protein n=1 Tax=Kribbella amoyensis TaxID=996641 RepID=A0A561BUA8_9ACTN|nr:hypothetical protein [Kribbella amoyensis]TWD82495.1 hypothetical protein FB561_3628 [Kribbella amoyensis]
MDEPHQTDETYNPWTVVNLVFHHLADEGLHPVLGAAGHPGEPAAALLVAFGIQPVAEGNAKILRDTDDQLADLRRAVLGEP